MADAVELIFTIISNVLTLDENLSGVRFKKTYYKFKDRWFATAGTGKYEQRFSSHDLERNTVEYPTFVSVGEFDITEFDGRDGTSRIIYGSTSLPSRYVISIHNNPEDRRLID